MRGGPALTLVVGILSSLPPAATVDVSASRRAMPVTPAKLAPAFHRLFEANLRHGLCVAVRLDDASRAAHAARLGSSAPPVAPHPLEVQAAASMASTSRAAAFCGGRAALHAAMRSCGFHHEVAIARAESGAPVLPSDVLASISHTRGLAAAIVRPASPGAHEAIGLDVEQVGRAFAPRLSERVLTAAERQDVQAEVALGSPAQAGVLVRFSLKEALYKALHQVGQHQGVAFRDVSVTPQLDGSARCVWSAPKAQLADDWAISLSWSVLSDFYVTSAHVRKR